MDREYLERWGRMADEWARRSDQWDRRTEQWDRRAEQWDRQEAARDEFMRETREEARMERERSDAMHADLREFIREMTARVERSGRELSEVLRAQTAELRDLREESRAQRNAVLKLLDRFGGPEQGGAAGTA